jgi:transcriptional regulator with PAS, ATPase and Fis domain
VRKVDVRVVAATNVDLEKAVAEGRFRRDLLYRLNIYPIRIPPLRERTDDIELIAMHLLQKFAVQHGKRMAGFTDRALLAIRAHAWPGNVRELENKIERGVILTPSDESVDADLLFPHITVQPGATLNAAGTLEHAAAPTAQATQLYDQLQSSGLTLEALEDT